MWLVYRLVPTLASKKYRKQSTVELLGSVEEEEEEEGGRGEGGRGGEGEGGN